MRGNRIISRRLNVYERENYKTIYIETRYRSYKYVYHVDTNSSTLDGNYVYGFYIVKCQKVDELPSNVPALK